MNVRNNPGEGYTRKVFKIFWAWQDEEEEKWLDEQSRAGWHLREVIPFSYTFTRGEESTPYTYRMDFKNPLDKDYLEYEQKKKELENRIAFALQAGKYEDAKKISQELEKLLRKYNG